MLMMLKNMPVSQRFECGQYVKIFSRSNPKRDATEGGARRETLGGHDRRRLEKLIRRTGRSVVWVLWRQARRHLPGRWSMAGSWK
jgi:hypothetical protein